MGHHRDDVVECALRVLDTYGLADLTMRRLGSELGVRPSALYHHFANKQALLAAVADEILARGRARRVGETGADWSWDAVIRDECVGLRESLLAWRDGAEVVATVHAFGLGSIDPGEAVHRVLGTPSPEGAGLDPVTARVAARTLLLFVFGHVTDEQTHLQAGSAGAIAGDPRQSSDFDLGLEIVVGGIAAHAGLLR